MMLMIRFQNSVEAFRAQSRDERGAALAEYGLLLALVALAAVGILAIFGESITGVFQAADDKLQDGIADANNGGTTSTTP